MTLPKVAAAASIDRTPVPAQHGIIRQINRVRIELIDALDRELSKFDISAPQLIVLASVANKEADSASGLCKSISSASNLKGIPVFIARGELSSTK